MDAIYSMMSDLAAIHTDTMRILVGTIGGAITSTSSTTTGIAVGTSTRA
jgi:hypothetical protein